MGCTLVALALGRGRATWISAGDSLLFRLGSAGIERLNADHSMAPAIDEAARAGEMSADEAASHPQRSILLSALTGRAISLIDERSIPLDGNDQFLLASDGLLSLSSPEIAAIAAGESDPDPDWLVNSLLAAVDAKGLPDQDNCTIVAIRGRSWRRRRSLARGLTFLAFGVILLGVALAAFLWRWGS
jgi:serine/threonine protein phosphatase PrpC